MCIPLDSVQQKDGSFAFDNDVATQLENPLVFVIARIQVPEKLLTSLKCVLEVYNHLKQ